MKTKSNTGSQRVVVASILAASVSLAFQGQTFASQVNPINPVLSCNQMNAVVVSAAMIGLPTNGAVVQSILLKPASNDGTGEFCQVVGAIKPVDPNAPDIHFQLNLPTNWNKKTMMFGGGAYDGELNAFLNALPAAPANIAGPQANGYVVFSNDGGHVAKPPFDFARDGSFATNAEALRNFTGDALKKTRDVAMQLIKTYYGHSPVRNYFSGGSMGGREGLTVAQKWPDDFDGVIAFYPVISLTGWELQNGRITRALAQPGAYLNQPKRVLVKNAVIQACDALDGVADGVISNVAACNARLHHGGSHGNSIPATLRCPGGGDTADDCLSDAQISMLKTFASPARFRPALASGVAQYPGYNVWGADLGIVGPNVESGGMVFLGLNQAPPLNPVYIDQPILTVFWDQWSKYFVTGNGNLNSLEFDPMHLGTYRSRIDELSLMGDAVDTNLSRFIAKGGKLLMLHGTSDTVVSPYSTAQYYAGLQHRMGYHAVRSAVRYYEVPGYGHSVGSIFNAGWDAVGALENWVEHGIAPANQIVTDKTVVAGRTRPLCDYPGWPQYKGHGDVNVATSFKCAGGHSHSHPDDRRHQDDEHDED